MPVVEHLLDISGIGRNRMAVRWVSAAEGQLFASTVSELTGIVAEMGPFETEKHKLQLAAVESVLRGQRLRWLIGMDRHLTERGNVYSDKLDEKTFQELVKRVATEEYEKALILEALREGPLSVREMAGRTGIPVYTVSLRLNDLERRGLAELKGYEGSTPKFVGLAA